jgi:alpha-L-rhamnosidase
VASLPGAELTMPTVGPFAVGAQYEMNGCGVADQKGELKKCVIVRKPVNKGFRYGLSVPGWHLYPSVMPDQMSQLRTPGKIVAVAPSAANKLIFTEQHGKSPDNVMWQALLKDGKPLTIPANTKVTALWDLGDYYCAYPQLTADGGKGATVVWSWAEGLFDAKKHKGNRNEFVGKTLPGVDDTFHLDGRSGAVFMPMWWRSGRWCALRVTTGGEPLVLRKLEIDETRYPIESQESFVCDDQRFPGIRRLTLRGLQMCMHETYVDCPYYEQQMYPGDTRVQMLVNHLISADDRLAKRAIDLLDYSRRDSGMTGMNYPTWGTQDSVTYSLIWPLMVNDCLQWRRCDPAWLKAKAVGLHSLLSGVAFYEREDGLIENLPGWSFIDWVPAWDKGIAPEGTALSSNNNLFYLHALLASANIEDALGESLAALRLREKAARVSKALQKIFWNEARGMLADDPAQKLYSEHVQCLALLADALPADRAQRAYEGLVSEKDLSRCTVYFSYYLFETYFKYKRADLFLKRLDLWKGYVDLGLCTPMEAPGESRSDCHAWGSHPITFMHTGLAGVRPAAPGFAKVHIEPCPGSLKKISCKTPHPDGSILTDLSFDDKGGVKGTITLPAGLTGEFVWNGKTTPLKPGRQSVE